MRGGNEEASAFSWWYPTIDSEERIVPGGTVLELRAGTTGSPFLVGDVVAFSSNTTGDKAMTSIVKTSSAALNFAGMAGVVVGGEALSGQQKMVYSRPEDIGLTAAATGQAIYVATTGIVWVTTDTAIATGGTSLVAASTTTAGHVQAYTPLDSRTPLGVALLNADIGETIPVLLFPPGVGLAAVGGLGLASYMEVDIPYVELAPAATQQIVATISIGSGSTLFTSAAQPNSFVWTTEDAAVATVSSPGGLITAVGAGTTYIRVGYQNTANDVPYDRVMVVVSA